MSSMKKIIALLLLISFFLSSCSWRDWEEQDEEEIIKTDFFVETTSWKSFSGESFLKKTGQVSSSQDIELTANASGRVSSVYVKPWDSVWVGKNLAKLEDNIGSYSINLQRGNNSIERAQINYESQKISLDKQIFDAGVNLENLQRSLATLRKDSTQSIIQAEDSLKNSQDLWNIEKLDLQADKLIVQQDKLDLQADKLDLQIEQFKNNIEKSRLDYEDRLRADAQNIESYGATLKTQYNTLIIFLDDIIEFSDEILGVTFLNRNENDSFESYLWANDRVQRTLSETRLIELIEYRNSEAFKNLSLEIDAGSFSQEQIRDIIGDIEMWYEDSKTLLSSLEQTINNSIKSVGSLGDIEINAFIGSINWYQSQLQWNYGAFLSFESWVESFFVTYRDNQNSILRNIELQEQDIKTLEKDKIGLEKDRNNLEKDKLVLEKDKAILLRNTKSGELSAETGLERTRIGINDNIASLETQIRSAQNTLSNARKNKDVTLRSLSNAIQEARIGYSSSAKEFEKLTVSSPINGTVSDVLVDAGQEVSQWTPLFRIVSDKTPEVEVSFSAWEKDLVKKGQKVFVEVDGERITGSIYAISDIADTNLNYKATITFQSGTNLIGNLVSVEVPIETGKMLLPLNIITTQWWEIGTVKTLSWSSFADVRVRMWEVFWEQVEIVSCAKYCKDLNIITNDIGNFDENKFKIVEK